MQKSIQSDSDIVLSPDQYNCYCSILDWINSVKSRKVVTKFDNILTVGGYAGTGKTTLIGKVRRDIGQKLKVAFCAYTGKAASVLSQKLEDQKATFPGDYCGTIHSLIYIPVTDSDTSEIIRWDKVSTLDYDLIICDEASMVGETILKDLVSFRIPILAVGDHGQLPPIESSINLMEDPDIRLEQIHRTAEDSPIIKLSLMARHDGYIPFQKFSDTVSKVKPNDKAVTDFIVNSGDFNSSAVLCGFNKTRINLNSKIRAFRNLEGRHPHIGERVICLRNNVNANPSPIYNGVCGTVYYFKTYTKWCYAEIDIDGSDRYKGKVSSNSFNNATPNLHEFVWVDKNENRDVDLDDYARTGKIKHPMRKRFLDVFDFGYCLTVHKSQGSEWDRVMVIEEPCRYWDGLMWNRWLYTAVTRAKETLLIVAN